MFCPEGNILCHLTFNKDFYECRKCLGWDKVIVFQKIEKKPEQKVDGETLLKKIYVSPKINNIAHELIMNVDKTLRENDWEFKTAADRDYVTDQVLQATIQIMLKFIQPERRNL